MLLLGLALIRFRLDLAVPFGWTLAPPPGAPYPATAALPSLLLILGLGLPVWWLARRPGLGAGRAWLAVALLGLLSAGLMQTSEAGLGRRGWVVNSVASTCSSISNGYFVAALEVDDVGWFLAGYDELQRRDTGKLSTHPPGAVMVYWLALRAYRLPGAQAVSTWLIRKCAGGTADVRLEIAAYPNVPPSLTTQDMPAALWSALFISLLAATAVVPTYLLGAADGDRRAGVLAAALLALMPNVVLYRLSLDGLLMALGAWSLVGLVWAARDARRGWLWALAAGVALGLAGFVSLGAAPMAGLGLAYLLLTLRSGELSPARAAGLLLCLAAGALLVLGAAALGGLAVWTVFRQALELHRHGGGGIGYREYLPWLLFNLVDYAAFVGLPVCLIAGDGIARGGLASTAGRLGWALAAVLLLLDLSGTVRAETERLWLFMNPLLAASAAAAAVGRADRLWPLATQPLQVLLLILALPPLVRPY